ncbi:tetratricopeptide repeat protein [Streptomyces chryseus]
MELGCRYWDSLRSAAARLSGAWSVVGKVLAGWRAGEVVGTRQASAQFLMWASHVHLRAGRLTAARSYAERSCRVLKLGVPGSNEQHTGGVLGVRCVRQLGSVAMWQGDWAVAERLLLEAKECAARSCGGDPIELASSYNQLGILYKFVSRFDDAADAYEKARERLTAARFEDHPMMAAVLHNLGGLAFSRGDYASGQVVAERSVRLRATFRRAGEPEIAADKAALGALLAQQGRLDEAARDFEIAMETYARLFGGNHPEWAVNANNLAVVEARRGNHARAEQLLNQALAVKEKALGPDTVDVATTLINLVDLHLLTGRMQQAKVLWEKAEAIAHRQTSPEHPINRAVSERRSKFTGL